MKLSKKLGAEFIGTFWLVLGGCGSAVLAAAFPGVGIGLLGVSLAFGLTVLTMAFQLCRSAQKRWIRLHHPERLGEVIRGIKFVDGIIEKRIAA